MLPDQILSKSDELDQTITQMSKAEISAFHDFEQVYVFQHPLPTKPSLSLHWQFWTALATSLAAVILAAFRTGQAFYIAAVARGNPFFSAAEAISAVVAIEGSVVLFALQRAREANKTDASLSWTGLFIAFIVSALAGLFQSFNLITSPSDTVSIVLNYTLVVAMGLGATILAWVSGDLLGVQLVRLEESKSVLDEGFAKTVHAYRANMLKAWGLSSEREAVNIHKSSRYGISVHERSVNGSRTGNEQRTPIGVPKEEIVNIFDTVLIENGSIAGVSDVARELMRRRNSDQSDTGFERLKGVVSETRKAWMKEKNIGGS